MDKYNKNPLRNDSNVISSIEKLKDEIIKKSEADIVNSRNDMPLECQDVPSPIMISEDQESTHNIDRQITDLENLIKRLQDDIIQTTSAASNETLGPSKCFGLKVENQAQGTDNYEENEFENTDLLEYVDARLDRCDNFNPFEIYSKPEEGTVTNPTFFVTSPSKCQTGSCNPIPTSLTQLPDEETKFCEAVKDLVSTTDSDKVPSKISAIRNNFSVLLNERPTEDTEDSLQVFIETLKSEISEIIETPTDDSLSYDLDSDKCPK